MEEGAWAASRPGAGEAMSTVPNELMPPRLRVPLMDCVKYASLDCSSCLYNAHRVVKVKPVSNVLLSKF